MHANKRKGFYCDKIKDRAIKCTRKKKIESEIASFN
jgi:hypothetical protein